MSLTAFKNFAFGTLASGIDSSATSLSLTTGHGARFPVTPFNATIYNSTDYTDAASAYHAGAAEIVRVTDVSTDTLTIVRAREGTTAVNHNTGGKTYTLVDALTAQELNPSADFFFLNHFQAGQSGIRVEGTWDANPTQGFGVLSHTRTSTGSGVIRWEDNEQAMTLNRSGTTWVYWRVKTNNLSSATTRYVFYVGAKDGGSDAGNNSFGIRYSDNVNSGKWQCWTRASGTESTADSGVTYAANTWYEIACECAASSGSVKFYIDGALVGTISTNVPTANLTPAIRFQVNVYAASVIAYCDYMGGRYTT